MIRALQAAGIEPDIVCGTSIGAQVGAAYVSGKLDPLEDWVRSLRLQTVVSFLDFSLNGGLIKGEKLIEFLRSHFVDRDIRELARPAEPESLADAVMMRIQTGMSQLGINHEAGPKIPAMLDLVANSINIMQVRVTRSRLAGDPPDVLVAPLLADLGLMEFHRAGVAIDAGRRAAEAVMPQLQARLNDDNGN